jgi:hypothetical protein
MTEMAGIACPKCPHFISRSNAESDGFLRCPACGKLTGPVGPTQTEFDCDRCGHRLRFRAE